MNKKNYINIANKSASIQINELKKIKSVFNNSFSKAIDLILNCKGKVIFSVIGKSGLIARKISATFSSVGIPSFFCHPSEALHGDMGQIEKKDILIIFSYSGNTIELTNMLKYANRYRIKIIGIASKPDSILMKASDIKINLPKVKESDITGMVPTSSTSITLLLGDCLATTVMHQKNFSKEKFKVFHPGGNIGSSLKLAKDIMVTGNKMPIVNFNKTLKQVLKVMNEKKLGIAIITKNKFIKGLITDGDLRREMNKGSKEKSLKKFIKKYPYVVNESMPASKALGIMNEKKITSLLVVSDKDFKHQERKIFKTRSIDLHGYTLDEANRTIENFINKAYLENVNKLVVVTGKGLHSENEKDPYVSKDLSILKYSVPEFILNNKSLMNLINEIRDAKIEDGGSGAFYIFLKKNK